MSPPIPEVGDQDPTERNSPIASEEDFETGSVGADDVPDERVCFYNAVDYPHGSYVKSGTAFLRYEGGVWVEAGPADSDNP